ncbi:hypothetical protein Bca101_074745 [Brassica carinata]
MASGKPHVLPKSNLSNGENLLYMLDSMFKGFYIQVWGSNPRLCNLLQNTGNPDFKSRRERFITDGKKAYKGSSTWCKIILVMTCGYKKKL